MIRQDARNFLLLNPEEYDVVISEPSNPWQSGNANLFTAEFYELVAARLSQGGFFCQWIPLYDFEVDKLQSMAQTFLQTFPYALAFKTHQAGDLLLVGSLASLDIDYGRLREKMSVESVRKDLVRVGIHSAAELLGKTYLFSEKALYRFAANAPVNSDDSSKVANAYYRIFHVDLQQNRRALRLALDKDSFPFVNIGSTPQDQAGTLYRIALAMQKAGRDTHAEYLAAVIDEL